MNHDEWFAAFEEMGEDAVRIKLSANQINTEGAYVATQWLAEKASKNQRLLRHKLIIDRMIDIAALIMATVAAVAAVIAAYLTWIK